MNLATLKTELDTGHPGTGAYDADAAIAAGQVNAANVTRLTTVDIEALREWASTDGRATKMAAAVAGGSTEDIRNAAYLMDTIFKSRAA